MVSGALAAGCRQVVIAGDLGSGSAKTIREEPPFSGPAAGLAAVLPEVNTDWFMLLACDLPHAKLLCHLLAESLHRLDPGYDGLLTLHEGRVQWLAGIYRTASVTSALERIDNPEGASMRTLFGGLKLREVQDPDGLSRDIDTPEELEAITKESETK